MSNPYLLTNPNPSSGNRATQKTASRSKKSNKSNVRNIKFVDPEVLIITPPLPGEPSYIVGVFYKGVWYLVVNYSCLSFKWDKLGVLIPSSAKTSGLIEPDSYERMLDNKMVSAKAHILKGNVELLVDITFYKLTFYRLFFAIAENYDTKAFWINS